VRRAALAAVLVVVLGAACTGDRPATTATGSPDGGPAATEPRCEARLGGVEGFVLTRSRDIPQGESIGVREEYRDSEGRSLTYLLGIFGEVGEGLPFQEEVGLSGGATARLLGRDQTWVLVWEDQFPCQQIAVIGNGFRRSEFVEVMERAALLPPDGGPPDAGAQGLLEWVAVFDVAEDPGDLEPGTDELMEAAGGAIAISPASCWSGLAVRLGAEPGDYVAAVVAQTRSELEAVTARVGRRPLVSGEFQAHCVD
jgi:hypothetical protein